MSYNTGMIPEFYYAIGRRYALEEELQKQAGIDSAPIIESLLWRRLLPAIGLAALAAPVGILSGRTSINQNSIKGSIGGLFPPTPTQVDVERNWRGGWGGVTGALIGGGIGAMAPEWMPLLSRGAKTIGADLL